MARLSTFSWDLRVAVDAALSPAARAGLVAAAARSALAEAQAQNAAALGMVPPHRTFVDRRENAPLESVDPDRGVIVFAFDIRFDLFEFIGRQLVLHSPVLTGEYQDSHRLYADGTEVAAYDPSLSPQEWVFTTPAPYARKIERGSSDQAPDGVYQAVAAVAAQRFGNVAAIRFTYRDVIGGTRGAAAKAARQPAIVVRLR